MKLFVIPFGGGNRYSFEPVKKAMPPQIDLHCIELPGRGFRMDEKLLTNISDLTNDIVANYHEIPDTDYALFGHCLGALLSFTVARKLSHKKAPSRLIVSGCGGPSSFKNGKVIRLSREDIQRFLIVFDTPQELTENESFLEMVSPIITADLTAHHSYVYEDEKPLSCPITIIKRDDYYISDNELALWQKETTEPIEYVKLDKGSNVTQLSSIIMDALTSEKIKTF